MASPSFVAPWKNSTFSIVPSGSEAEAERAIVAGEVNSALLVGEVNKTDGGTFSG